MASETEVLRYRFIREAEADIREFWGRADVLVAEVEHELGIKVQKGTVNTAGKTVHGSRVLSVAASQSQENDLASWGHNRVAS